MESTPQHNTETDSRDRVLLLMGRVYQLRHDLDEAAQALAAAVTDVQRTQAA